MAGRDNAIWLVEAMLSGWYYVFFAGEMDRLREFWLTGACKKQALGKGRESSHSLDIINFTSAYILLIVGIVLAVTLALIEHTYFMFCRRKLRKIDKCGCCSLISLVSKTTLIWSVTCDSVTCDSVHYIQYI